MGNCLKPIDPLIASIPKTDGLDVSAVRESRLPIIFLIGGPGAGKKTQCTRIAQHYNFLGIVSRDLLRDEVATGTQRAVILARIISEGHLVPSDILLELIKARMLSGLGTARGFLLSGFPREKEQSKFFNKHIRPPDLVLYLCVRNSLLIDRILARTITATERQERSFDEIRQRIKNFNKRNKWVLRHHKKKLIMIDGEKEESDVFKDICSEIDKLLTNFPNGSRPQVTN